MHISHHAGQDIGQPFKGQHPTHPKRPGKVGSVLVLRHRGDTRSSSSPTLLCAAPPSRGAGHSQEVGPAALKAKLTGCGDDRESWYSKTAVANSLRPVPDREIGCNKEEKFVGRLEWKGNCTK
eukprot:767480-Hanusia_phi.AAC.4